MSELITLLFNQILIEKIETELLTYYINYNKVINIEEYKTIVKELVKNKYNFKIIEPSEIVFFKNLYEKKFNKRPNGKKANDITWLKTQLNEVDYNQYEISELIRNNIYKPRYVSRMHFSKKKINVWLVYGMIIMVDNVHIQKLKEIIVMFIIKY